MWIYHETAFLPDSLGEHRPRACAPELQFYLELVIARVCGKVMLSYSVCVTVNTSLQDITFERLDIETSFVVC